MEQLARDKVEIFEKDQKMSERKVVLGETISKCTEEEKKVRVNSQCMFRFRSHIITSILTESDSSKTTSRPFDNGSGQKKRRNNACALRQRKKRTD